ncbi:MAG: hypothetical protein IJ497_07135 [Clostridia bacterium]|nr:hypothetical protein [Clostridia bacterium]MBQ8512372.1 hypothetical protein [Clostridia bacterium]
MIPTSEILHHCRTCEEPIYDGDTAYRLGSVWYCPACIDNGRQTARRERAVIPRHTYIPLDPADERAAGMRAYHVPDFPRKRPRKPR